MTQPLAITERQARTLLRAADRERGIVEVKVGNTFVRLIPECIARGKGDVDGGEDIRL